MIMSFTDEQVNALPTYTDKDKLKPGDFAKMTWMKAKPSLVYIVRNDPKSTDLSYCNCNRYNGHFDGKGYSCTVVERRLYSMTSWTCISKDIADLNYLLTEELIPQL